MQSFAIIGAGAWGTALAVALWRAGRDVTLWAHRAQVAAAINKERENRFYLPGVQLDPAIKATHELADAVGGADALLLVIPAQHLRAVGTQLQAQLSSKIPVVICAKGIEQTTGALMTEVAVEVLPDHPLAVLSGPSFAADVARDLPAAVTLAASDQALAEELAASIGSRNFRPYLSNDPTGVEIGGAVKNVIAIACGIVTGRKLGDSARAALITRGLAEVVRLGRKKGGRAETLMGLSGLGDLTLTCTSTLSRNYTLGIALGEGQKLSAILAERQSVAEGVFTAAAIAALAKRLDIDMPICLAVDAILNQDARIDTVIEELLTRPLKVETV